MHHIRPAIIGGNSRQRKGRGFSSEELDRAGLSITQAKKLKLPYDPRRKTMHAENVEKIKRFAAKSQQC